MRVVVVGQGIAGTLLAFELERRGIDFMIIDSGVNHSSSVAAGIMNPVVFRRLTKSWRVDDAWDLAIETYQRLEQKLGSLFLYDKPMRRLFASEQEAGFWQEKTSLVDFQKYIAHFPEGDVCPEYAKNSHGSGLVKRVYHVDVKEFIHASKNYFEAHGKLITSEVDYDAVLSELKSSTLDAVFFCQGYRNLENPFFAHLPVQTTKGQILTIKNSFIAESELLNRKCFLLPLGQHLFRVGATYEWENTSLNTTEKARVQLCEKLESLIDSPYEVIAQEAGIRPTTPDRRPILGEHPHHKNMYILNGLGTKGYLLAPWSVQHLCEHVLNNLPLSDEVNLARFGVI